MAVLTFKKRVWIVKQYLKKESPSDIALAQNIDRRSVYKLVDKFNQFGWEGLQDHKTGRPETILNPKVQDIILAMRKGHSFGPLKIEQELRQKGFGVSHRQIEKVIIRAGLVQPNIRKQRPRTHVRFEMPSPNDMWHTDWTYDPYTEKNLSAYIDDRTRLITSHGVFPKATSENSIALLKAGILEYGKPKSVMTDHGSQYYANREDSIEQNTQFRITLNVLGIKHYLARVNRPQTNGKIERWFGTYKEEYAKGTFSGITDFVRWYNEERLHMSLGYRTPLNVWNELKDVP